MSSPEHVDRADRQFCAADDELSVDSGSIGVNLFGTS
jgi:hypothetical protein